MKIRAQLLCAGTVLGVYAATAHAGTALQTPPLLSAAHSTPQCLVVNVQSAPIDVAMELLDENSAVVASATCSDLAGGHTCTVSAAPRDGSLYCTASTLRLRTICVTMMMIDDDGVVTSAVVSRRED